MVQFVYNEDETISTFVAKLQGAEKGPERCKTIGVLDDQGRFLGGIVFYNWNPDTRVIEMSAAAVNPSWLSRRTLNRIGDFVFHECGCQLLLVYVPENKVNVLRVLAAVGFSFTRIPRLFGRNADGVLCTLADDEWYDGRISHGRPVEEAA